VISERLIYQMHYGNILMIGLGCEYLMKQKFIKTRNISTRNGSLWQSPTKADQSTRFFSSSFFLLFFVILLEPFK